MVVLMKMPAATGCCLVLCGALACATVQPAPVEDTVDRPEANRVIEIVAERFLFTPSEITIEAGTTVEFRLTSEDTDHGFRIVGPGNIDITIPKRNRGAASALFAPTEPGDYRFECSRLCGAGHSYMSGVIRVRAAPSAPSEPAAEGGSQ